MSFAARATGYSATLDRVYLPSSLTVSTETAGGVGGSASFSLESAGTYSSSANYLAPSGTWKLATDSSGNYEARMTLNSGSFDSGTTGSWLALSTTRTWSITVSGVGYQAASCTLEIRESSGGVVLATSTFNMSVFADF